MTRRVVLHNTGMDSKKYGSFERYLVRVAELCRERGYGTVLQYESAPRSSDYVQDLTRAGARIEVLSSRGSAASSILACSSLIVKHRPAVVHNHFVGKLWKATVPLVGRMAGARTLINSIHGLPAYRGPSSQRFIYDRYDHILPVSEAVRANLLLAGVDPSRVRTLYLGLFGNREPSAAERRQVRQRFRIPLDARVIGCIAFAAKVKGVDMLLKAMRQIVEREDDVYLLQIGVEPSSEELFGLSENLGLRDRVAWAGVVDDGWRMLSAVDIYVQPSRSEGLPFTLMEAMAMKLPIVCTGVSGNVEAIVNGQTGIVVDPDPDSLAAAITRLLEQPQHWADYGESARRRFERLFEGEASARKLVDDYYDLGAELQLA